MRHACPPHRLLLAAAAALLSLGPVAAARADLDAGSDSLYLVGEFVDPVCTFQHGMQGAKQRECAMVRGRVEQGMYFLDIRQRRLYSVIGQTHWEDPRAGFLAALGDTVAIRARVWRRYGDAAIAVSAVYPYRQQPPATIRMWPWHWEWSVLLGCALLALAWAWAVGPARRRLGAEHDRIEWGRGAVFLAGLLTVVVALDGPLHDLSDRHLFSAHMVQHLLLGQVFAPLFVLGIPTWLLRRLLRPPAIRRVWGVVTGVPLGFVIYNVGFSLWHLPLFYELMMRSHGLHIAMHLAFMATALMLWWPIVGARAVERPMAEPAQMLYLFLLSTPMMAVAALLVFAPQPLYAWYALAPRLWGLSPLDDQKLGALIMWVPGGLFWWGVMSVIWFRWAAREGRGEREPLIHGTT